MWSALLANVQTVMPLEEGRGWASQGPRPWEERPDPILKKFLTPDWTPHPMRDSWRSRALLPCNCQLSLWGPWDQHSPATPAMKAAPRPWLSPWVAAHRGMSSPGSRHISEGAVRTEMTQRGGEILKRLFFLSCRFSSVVLKIQEDLSTDKEL